LGPARPAEVDVEAQPAVLKEETRDATVLDEVVQVTNRQHGRICERLGDCSDPRRRRARHIQDVAGPEGAIRLDTQHGDAMTQEGAILHGARQFLDELAVVEDADRQLRGRGQRGWRPFDEFCDVIDKRGLERRLRHLLRPRGRSAEQADGQSSAGA